MKQKKDVTIYDIARRLDISSATVSRGLQNHPSVNKNTRQRIQDAARELGYRYNNFAGSLRKQRTNTIGVIVHELKSGFITSVLAGIERVATEAGYDLVITHSSESKEKELANALNLFHKRVDGLIASLAFDTENLDHFRPYEEKGIPILFFDRVDEASNHTAVVIDNYRAAYQATRHLIDQGCRRIAHVTSSLKRNVYSQRFRGFRDALYDCDLPFDEELLVLGDLSEQAAVNAATKLIKTKPWPDGAFITNDFLAAVFIKNLRQHGVRVPEDVAVVGFNNDVIGKIVEPELTTVNYPGLDVGEVAARALINHLRGISNLHQTNRIIVPSELVIRQSSIKKRG